MNMNKFQQERLQSTVKTISRNTPFLLGLSRYYHILNKLKLLMMAAAILRCVINVSWA